jgi:hypothetical protein
MTVSVVNFCFIITYSLSLCQGDDEFQAYAMEDESDDEGLRRDHESKEMSKKPA